MWRGMSNKTGKLLTDADHVRQSLMDIISTPVGSRIMRRNYGSYVPLLIDQPQNATTRMRLMAATVMAITEFEPRVQLTNVDVYTTSDGKLCLSVTMKRRDNGELLTISDLEVPR